MMGVLKTFALSVAIVVALQIRVKNVTIENHILAWSRSTKVSSFLNRVTLGAIDVASEAAYKAKLAFQALMDDSSPISKDAKR